jgi:hypothetical protein
MIYFCVVLDDSGVGRINRLVSQCRTSTWLDGMSGVRLVPSNGDHSRKGIK